jgi:FAD/FMN-containing dehydrogenase
MRDLIADLSAISGTEHVLTDPDVMAGYVTDWTRRYRGTASCVVLPDSAAQTARVLRCCAGHGVPVIPQGGNTSLVGGSVPAPAGSGHAPVLLSTRRLTDLQPVDAAAGQVTAGAGVNISRLRAHAVAAGLAYGVDLASRDSATVGGTIATNAGGIRTIRYGPTRAQLLGVSAVLANGSVMTNLSGLAAGTTGYDLAQLLAGSEGTLAVITAARLRLWPAEPVVAVLLSGVGGITGAAELCGRLRAAVPGLRAAEYVDAAGLDLVCAVTGLPAPLPTAHRGYLLAEIGAVEPGGTALDAKRLARADLPSDTAIAQDGRGQAALWAYRERLTEAIASRGVPHKIDVAVPAGALGAFRAELDQVVAVAAGRLDGLRGADDAGPAGRGRATGGDLAVIVFGHIGVGNLHVNVLGPDPADTAVDAAVARLAAAHGGSAAAEHGVGRAKTGWLSWSRSPAEIAAMRAIKTALDPAGLLNPGVLLPRPFGTGIPPGSGTMVGWCG